MVEGPKRRPLRERRESGPFPPIYVLWAFLAGLLVSPLLYVTVGALLQVEATSSHKAESDAILTTFGAVGKALFGAVYWCAVAVFLRRRAVGRRAWVVAAGVFLVLVVGSQVARL